MTYHIRYKTINNETDFEEKLIMHFMILMYDDIRECEKKIFKISISSGSSSSITYLSIILGKRFILKFYLKPKLLIRQQLKKNRFLFYYTVYGML